MDFKRILTLPKYQVLVFGLLVSLAYGPNCSAITANNEIQNLEKTFQSTTTELYTALAKNLNQCRGRTRSLKRLNLQLEKLATKNKNIIGICLIQNHLPLIEKNIDNKEIFHIVEFLLKNNNLTLANKIFNIAKSEADQSFLSNISFIYARYYLKRKKWEATLKYIEGTYNDLKNEDANLARIFTGIALQKTKQHRQAVKIYSKIPQHSKHYPIARLNIATAYIRQDWWTDAHVKIKEILKHRKIKTNNEMINRLYLVLGYSLLRKEFYRDSREAFRNIETNSVYFNKALLGIALTATNQEDYIGALNAINRLKSKNTYDLSVDESHLLLPYTFEKLNQNMTASASYTEAQQHYKKRIQSIELIRSNKTHNIKAKDILNNNSSIEVDKNIINLTNYYYISFLENSSQLDDISEYIVHINDSSLVRKYTSLRKEHNILLNKIISDAFNQRLTYLNSCLNQTRFGIARLFDNSNLANN